MSSVECVWRDLTAGMPETVAVTWWTELLKNYNESYRFYHNIEHLLEKFNHYLSIKQLLKNPNAVAFAIFFNYFEYVPKAVDCVEKNIEIFHRFLDAGGIPTSSPLCTEVVNLLLFTCTHSTDEHKIVGAYGSEDYHYFLDIDMAVLGSSPRHYAEYISKVRQEYDFLPDFMYDTLRLKVLETFLEIPNIYASKVFRDKYEQQARANIEDEVRALQS